MPVSHITQRNQLTIPRAIREKLHLSTGDRVEIREQDGRIVIEPVKDAADTQAYFRTPAWQAMEDEADADIRESRTSGPFEDAISLQAHLNGLKKK